jgi:peptidoglycan hydrolase CwlO-like protein
MSGNSTKNKKPLNKKKVVAESFIPYDTGYINVAGETFFLSMGTPIPESFQLTDDSLKTDDAFQILFLGGDSKTFTDVEQKTLQRVIRAIFGTGLEPTKKGIRLPCKDEEVSLLVKSLAYRRSLLIDEIASYDELQAEDIRARYLRDHLERLDLLIDEQIPSTIAPCKDTDLVDPNKPRKVVGLDDARMLRLLEIFAYLLAQGYDPVEVLSKKMPLPTDILPRIGQPKAPLLRDYETEFEREHGAGKKPNYTRTLIKIKKVLEDDKDLVAAIAPEEALEALAAIEDKLTINKTHEGTIQVRRDAIIEAIDKLQKALAAALEALMKLQEENERLRQELAECRQKLKECEEKPVPVPVPVPGPTCDCEALKKRIAELEVQLAEVKEALAKVTAELARVTAELIRVQAELARVTAELATAKARITELETELAAVKAELATAKARIVELEAEQKVYLLEITRLSNDIRAYQAIVNDYYTLCEDILAKSTNGTRTPEETNGLLDAALAEIVYFMNMIEEYQKLVNTLQADLNACILLLEEFQLLLDELLETIQNLTDKYEELQKDYVDLYTFFEQLYAIFQEYVKITTLLSGQKELYEKRIQNLEDELAFFINIVDQLFELQADSQELIDELLQRGAERLVVSNDEEALFFATKFYELYALFELNQALLKAANDKADKLAAQLKKCQDDSEDIYNLLNEYVALADDYDTALRTVIDENEALRIQVDKLTQENAYVKVLINLIWKYLEVFIRRLQTEGLVVEGEYPIFNKGDMVQYKGSIDSLKGFLEGLHMPAIVAPQDKGPDAAMLCMLNTLYFILISQLNPTIPAILLEIYAKIPQKEIQPLLKYFFSLVIGIRNNQQQLEGIGNTEKVAFATILHEVMREIAKLTRYTIELLLVFENFTGNADFFKFDYSTGPQKKNPDKQGQTALIYKLFLAILAGTLNDPVNQAVMNAAGCPLTIANDPVLPLPPPPPPPPQPQFDPMSFCDEYRKIYYRSDGQLHGGEEYRRKQAVFRARFTPEQFALIESKCPHIQQEYVAQARGSEFLRPPEFPTGTSASAIGSKQRAGISAQPLPKGLASIALGGGGGGTRRNRSRGNNSTRKRRVH